MVVSTELFLNIAPKPNAGEHGRGKSAEMIQNDPE
jgi:hypothetical protein